MGQVFADQKKMAANEDFTIDWIPGTGTVIAVKGKAQGAGRADQGSGVLQRHAAHLDWPESGRLETQRGAAGQVVLNRGVSRAA